MPPVFRFAPSPNGYLHLGHALSALLNANKAREAGGRLLLRIEDIDDARCRPEYETVIYEDLAWLGVAWEQTSEQPVRRQSDHLADYRAALAKLDTMGLIYPAFESRTEIARIVAEREAASGQPWPRDPDGGIRYPELSKSLPADERRRLIEAGAPYALRLDMAAALERIKSSFRGAREREPGIQKQHGAVCLDSGSGPSDRPGMTTELTWTESGIGPNGETGLVAADPAAWGDIILARKDTPNSYHLSVVVDDALQGVTDVVRGRDLFHSTAAHRVLQTLLGLPQPRYHHHRLILDTEGRKLSKSTAATSLREIRARGVIPAQVRTAVGLD
jgi:glutamyl-Q tRNA(Asp) synthetase